MPDEQEPQGAQGRDGTPARDARTGRSAAAARIEQQQSWVDLQVRKAMDRGDFHDLPGKGKPIEGLGRDHDPDWWLKKLVERERIVVLPVSVQLRKEDADLDETLDRLNYEDAVRRHVEDFNQRVVAARYRLPEGPPRPPEQGGGGGAARGELHPGGRRGPLPAPGGPAAGHDAPRRRRRGHRLAGAQGGTTYGAGRSRRPGGAGGAHRAPGEAAASDPLVPPRLSRPPRRQTCQIRHTDRPRSAATFRPMTGSSRSAKDFFRPLAVGAPTPLTEIPARPSRAIHFFDPSNAKMAAKVPDMVGTVDVLLGNLEDAIKADNKVAAREGLVRIAQEVDFGPTQLWTRVNALDSPWGLDDLTTLVPAIGDRLDVIMVPKVQGAEDIHYVDRLLAQLEAKAGLDRPILVHAILETARRVASVEEFCGATPRMQGLTLGPADLAADRRMKTTRVGGGHPGYLVRQDPVRTSDGVESPTRATYQQDLWHYTIARMVDACAMHGIYPYYGPFGDIADTVACEDQFRNAFLLGCVGAWSLHPKQIAIANKVFSPSAEDVRHARRVIDAMGDGTGAVMLDGKMEDDASVKQCRVMVALADELAAIDPELKKQYDEIDTSETSDQGA